MKHALLPSSAVTVFLSSLLTSPVGGNGESVQYYADTFAPTQAYQDWLDQQAQTRHMGNTAVLAAARGAGGGIQYFVPIPRTLTPPPPSL